MTSHRKFVNLGATALLAVAAFLQPTAASAQVPDPPREYRGVWLTTVFGLDWPLASDTAANQQTKLRAILDKCKELNINVVHFQVRPASDAFYTSSIEPTSHWLTGTSGKAATYDPLAYCITEARARGIEVHAWVNPFRAKVAGTYTVAANHITRTRPDLCVTYDGSQWINPGLADGRNHVRNVINDIVARYDIDGLIFDDYFYPYPVSGQTYDDSVAYNAYTAGGGTLPLADWRRSNVDNFVQTVYSDIKASKQHVKFGISPFGIWRPGNPSGIVGLDSYASLYADSKKWLNNGWVDVFSPQLYWKLNQTGQQYTLLMPWWASQNTQGRVLAPALNTIKVADGTTSPWAVSDITSQISFSQGDAGDHGNVHYRMLAFMANSGAGRDNINATLKTGVYAQQALVPAVSWLDSIAPAAPTVTLTGTLGSGPFTLDWTANGSENAANWVVQWKNSAGVWQHSILDTAKRTFALPGSGATAPTEAAVTAVDRCGNLSTKVVLSLLDSNSTPTPTPTPSPTPTPTPTPSPTPTPTPTATPTATPSPTPTATPTPAPATSLSVNSIVPSLPAVGGGRKSARVVVTVRDNNGNLVQNATVTGNFTGTFTETKSGATASNGTVTLTTSGSSKGTVTFQFCVTGITHGTLSYNATANVETCDGM